MFRRFTAPSRLVVEIAGQEAGRLGHEAVDTEHLLLGVALQGDQSAALVLARRGLTAPRIRSEIDRLRGRGPGGKPGVAPSIDAAALATLGIDLDAVRRRVEASFGPGALARKPGGCGGEPEGLLLPFTPSAKKSLELGSRESLAQRRCEVTPDHIVLGLLGAGGNAAHILHEHAVTAAALRPPSHRRRPPRLFRGRSDHLAG